MARVQAHLNTLTRRAAIALLAAGASACAIEGSESPGAPIVDAPALGHDVEVDFELLVDPANKKIEFSQIGQTARGLGPARVVQNGAVGSGPPNSVEMVTSNLATDVDGSGACGFASSFCADVFVRSFYTNNLQNVHVQLTGITPAASHPPLNSDPPAFGLGNTFGLWGYGSMVGSGSGNSRQWVFGDDGTAFRITGRVMADLALINWEVSTNGGVSFAPVNLPDTGWGCDNCSRFYRATLPFRPSQVTFRYASDNMARLFVNGSVAYDDFFLPGFCSDRPCCSRCCDTPGNCFAGLSDVATLDAAALGLFTTGNNTLVWEVVEEFGGDGFYVDLIATP